MLQITGLKKQFRAGGGSLPILDIPSWQVNTGEQVALTGPSGSGKSTLLHLISGISLPDEGSIELDGLTLTAMSEARRDRFRSSMIGYVLQDFHLIPSLSARQNIGIAMNATLPNRRKNSLILEWLDRVGLADRADHLPSQLSRGQQQRVAIVRALVNNPPYLLADEPTGSLDCDTAADLSRLLLELSADGKQTLIAVTHDANLAARFPKQIDIREINVLHKTSAKPKQTVAAGTQEANPA